jgi:hypothetical protein
MQRIRTPRRTDMCTSICSCGGAREMVIEAVHEARYALTILCYLCATTKFTRHTSASTTLFHCFHTCERDALLLNDCPTSSGTLIRARALIVTWPTGTDYATMLWDPRYRLDVARSFCKEFLRDASGQRLSQAIVRSVPLTCSSWKFVFSTVRDGPMSRTGQ